MSLLDTIYQILSNMKLTMQERFDLVEQPVREIWWQIFSSVDSKELYLTLNKYFLHLLQVMIIELPTPRYGQRIRALPYLAKSKQQELSLIECRSR